MQLESDQLQIKLDSAQQISTRSIDWQLWLDINDDGIYQVQNERVWQQSGAANSVYQLDSLIDLSAYKQPGSLMYARLIGDYAQLDACHAHADRSIDFIIQW